MIGRCNAAPAINDSIYGAYYFPPGSMLYAALTPEVVYQEQSLTRKIYNKLPNKIYLLTPQEIWYRLRVNFSTLLVKEVKW